ncbi:MAG TPA: class I SAM-dependent methyltransferase, partial [Methylomirabilota bacterium]|nr:class I SAM-dependent methyltransferase [Methylomirabilota bacterium]
MDPSALDPAGLAACPTTPETSYALASLGPLAGRHVLDLGCGYGETAAWLALQGASVEAVDISPRMVEVSRGLAARCGVERRIRFHVGPGESLPFEAATFDVAFGHDVLHHM